MKTNKILAGLCFFFVMANLHAENNDSIQIANLENVVQQEISARKLLNKDILELKQLIKKQSTTIKEQGDLIDSLNLRVSNNKTHILSTAESLGIKINETSDSLNNSIITKADADDLQQKSFWGSLSVILLFVFGGLIYFLLHRRINRGNENVEMLRQKADKINEDILNQFSLDMDEMKKISLSLNTLTKVTESNSNNDNETDHSLIKTLADRITFMEMTLYKMDPKVRGYKQLTRSISQMKDNLLANGYELVEMLGKPYNEGMKVMVNFIEDEELETGEQIITGIVKPQINYKGVMIQSAQITVSQNI